MDRILHQDEVLELLGIARMSLYRMRRAGKFPPHVEIGSQRIGWPESEIKAWVESRRRPAPRKAAQPRRTQPCQQ